MDKFVITIGREFGSGGREIARQLANKFNVKCYDKEIVAMASEHSGIHEDMIKTCDEKAISAFSFVGGGQFYLSSHGAHNMQVQANFSQFSVIKKIAENESCVFVGRVADYVLKNHPNHVSIFISANFEDRVKRIMEYEGISEQKAEKLIYKNDKNREKYYNFFTNKKWGNSSSYDVCINSSMFGIDKTVDVLFNIIKEKLEIKD